ncbi:hypothetical protein SAMN05216198_2010 [Halopseudomonas litoralis]|uniref:Uncharacterized protein n=1 Tax=Halopseudomonas litoralis TaxID=797277 RepID=A0A1H1SEH2_9GAMM|nr:hypothetical protein SAMN05216198_2010 [Halopseudomonas litoralis]
MNMRISCQVALRFALGRSGGFGRCSELSHNRFGMAL